MPLQVHIQTVEGWLSTGLSTTRGEMQMFLSELEMVLQDLSKKT